MECIDEFSVAGLVIGNFYMFDHIKQSTTYKEMRERQILLIQTVYQVLVIIIDTELRKMGSVEGVTKSLASVIADKLTQKYEQLVRTTSKHEMKLLYCRYLDMRPGDFGGCKHTVYMISPIAPLNGKLSDSIF